MTTVGDVVDRVFREYLRRPSEQPIVSSLASAVTANDLTLTLSDGFTPEEEELLGAGSIIEVGSELVRVSTYNSTAATVSVSRRGVLGTTASVHDADTDVVLAPSVSRRAVFDAVADAISNLYPDLYGTTTVRARSGRFIPIQSRPRSILQARAYINGFWQEVQARLVQVPETPTGWAIEVEPSSYPARTVILVTVEPARPTAESDELEDLFVDESWVKIVVLDAAATLLHAEDVSGIAAYWLTQSLEEQVRPMGSVENLAVAIERYRERLVARARRRLLAIYGTYTEYLSPI